MTDDATQLSPADGIKVINHSLRCFAFSLASLIPLIGLPLALVGFSHYRKARAIVSGRWNPARQYLLWGSVLGSLGFLISLVVVLFIACALLKILPWQYARD